MQLKKALKYIGLNKSTYFYTNKERILRKKRNKLDKELEKILLELEGYELTLGYRKLTKYLCNKHLKIWNKKKIYRHMKELKLLQSKMIKRNYIRNKRLKQSSPIRSNVRWEADMTYVATRVGNMYLFVIEDVYDKEIISGYYEHKE